ncbi:hypothetical protein J5N97_026581 [Dioscorea zingiberensis]|uniref:DUF4283 domain-containing protein n=1 Tax=Dioscorea zingiberensis TaxID=325984 RepID=A0A9D5C3G2_9LILI|nr:hypothetical protein J5N97_026581 [Dioscorea zingiberensis]
MPNGFYLIQCSSSNMLERLLTEGPWSINGNALHLLRWKDNFQPAFEKLSTAIIWVHLYNLPSEYWDMDTLETVASNFGKLLKVDIPTMVIDRRKFARICVEINLNQPLKRGVWVRSTSANFFVPVAYEKLPPYCFRCGIIGHYLEACTVMSTGSLPKNSDTGTQNPDSRGEEADSMEVAGSERKTTVTPEEPSKMATCYARQRARINFGTWLEKLWR